MARLAATLSTKLQAIAPTLGPGSAALAQSYADYMADATALAPITVAALPAAATAMSGAMTFAAGASAAAGAAVVAAGVAAFWAAMTSPASAYFAGATIVTPPPALAGLAAALAPVLVANAAPGTTLVQASNAIAAVLHAASSGGTATTPGPVVTPIA